MPVARLCLDCATFCTATRCERCAAARRGERAQAYDAQHQVLRARLIEDASRDAQAGRPWRCARCGLPMLSGQPLDLGHDVDVADGGGRGARRLEHRSCNRAAGGARSTRGGGGRS